MTAGPSPSAGISAAKAYAERRFAPGDHESRIERDPDVEQLVNELIGRVADKWTMLVLDILAEHGELRFTRLGKLVGGISQKMLTQTLRGMERNGLVVRTVHPVVPPRVDYRLTEMGFTLSAAFCGVWMWAAEHHAAVEEARRRFESRPTA